MSSLNYSTLIMLLGFPLNNVIENKVIIKEPLISFVDLILKILEFFALAC